MALQRSARWTCDRCGQATDTEFVGDTARRPTGWGSLGSRDLCTDCTEAYQLWWDAAKAGRVVVIQKRVADDNDWDPTKDGLG